MGYIRKPLSRKCDCRNTVSKEELKQQEENRRTSLQELKKYLLEWKDKQGKSF